MAVTFRQVESNLTALLQEFGRPRRLDHLRQPLWPLQRDGVSIVHMLNGLASTKGAEIRRIGESRSHDFLADFSLEVPAALAADLLLVATIAFRILEQHFPGSLSWDILNAVGLTLETAATMRKRDPALRQLVLKAYAFRWAICGFDVRLGSVSIAVDVADLRCDQAGGPVTEDYGLAACVVHSKTFDIGAFVVRARPVSTLDN